MRPIPRPTRKLRLAPALAWLGLMLGGFSATGATVSPGPSHGAPGHRCKCGMDCGDTCCCVPKPTAVKTRRPEPAPAPIATTPARRAAAPCVSKVPCGGDPGMPDAPPSARPSKAAALAADFRMAPSPAGVRLLPPTTPPRANPSQTPPFEPPEIPGRPA